MATVPIGRIYTEHSSSEPIYEVLIAATPAGLDSVVGTVTNVPDGPEAEAAGDILAWALAAAYEKANPGFGITSINREDFGFVQINVTGESVPIVPDPCGSFVSGVSAFRDENRKYVDGLMRLGNPYALALELEEDVETVKTKAEAIIGSAIIPPEYAPVSVQVDEDSSSIFVEPGISATYFDCVNLRVGGLWFVSDFGGGKLYACYVKTRNQAGPGLMSYTFVTLMTLLNHTEPPSLLVAAGDAGMGVPGPDGEIVATPAQALEYILTEWQKVLPQLTWAPVPDLFIRTGTGDEQGVTAPTVPVIHLVQEQNPKSMREFLESMFGVFQGYTYRMDGWQLQIIPPAWAVTLPTVATLTDEQLISLSNSQSDDSIINTQKVNYRPWEFVGDFTDPDTLPDITDPAYYRVGDGEKIPKPDNRLLLTSGKPAPWALDMAAKKDKVRVTWAGYIFLSGQGTAYGQPLNFETAVDVSDDIAKAVHVFEMTSQGYYIAETRFNVFINQGDGGVRDFFGGSLRNQLARSDNGPLEDYINFRWRLEMKGGGVTATLLYPQPDTVFTFHEDTVVSGQGVVIDVNYRVGAEFHLNVQGITFQQSRVTYSATYGVHVPAIGVTPPEGFEMPTEVMFGRVPPKLADYEEDPLIKASYDLYGVRNGPEINIEVWTLTLPTERDLVGEPVIDWNTEYEADIIASLGGIAETIVKNRINPSREYLLELSAPFALSPDAIGGRVALPDAYVGDLTRIGYQEAHAPGSVALSATATVTVLELGDITRTGGSKGPPRDENVLPHPTAPDGSDAPVDPGTDPGNPGDDGGSPGDTPNDPGSGYTPPPAGGPLGTVVPIDSYTVGVTPTDWTKQWYGSTGTIVVNNSGVDGKKALTISGTRAAWEPSRNLKNMEVLIHFKKSGAGGGINFWHTGLVNAERKGVAVTLDGSTAASFTWRKYRNSGSALAQTVSYPASVTQHSAADNIWFYLRALLSGNSIKMKSWLDTVDEPANWFSITGTDQNTFLTDIQDFVGGFGFGTNAPSWSMTVDYMAMSGEVSPSLPGSGGPAYPPGPVTPVPGESVVIDVSNIPTPASAPANLTKFRADPAYVPTASMAWWLDRVFASINRQKRNPEVETNLAKRDMYKYRTPKNEVHYLVSMLPGCKDMRITDQLCKVLNLMLDNLYSAWSLKPDGSKSPKYQEFEGSPNWVNGGGYYHLQYLNDTENIAFYGTDTIPLEETLAHDPISLITAVMGINADLKPEYLAAFKRGAAYMLEHWEPKWMKRIGRDQYGVLKFKKAISHSVAGELMVENGLVIIKELLGKDATVNKQARDRLAFRLVSDRQTFGAPNGQDVTVWRHQNAAYNAEAGGGDGDSPHKLVYLTEIFGSLNVAHEMGIAGFESMGSYANDISQLLYPLTNTLRVKGDVGGSGFFSNGAATPDQMANNTYPDQTLPINSQRFPGGNVAWADPTPDKQNLKVLVREMTRESYSLAQLEQYPSQTQWRPIFSFALAASKNIDVRDL